MFVAMAKDEDIWVSQPYYGVYKISKKANGKHISQTYADKADQSSALNNYMYKIKNEVVVVTENGVFNYNPQKIFSGNRLIKKKFFRR